MGKRILCIGDSNTWGYIPGSGERYEKNVRWTGKLAQTLGENYEVIEEGMNGRKLHLQIKLNLEQLPWIICIHV